MILFKKKLFDLEVKGQGPTKVITVHDTPPYGHAPTYQISLTYLERQKCYGLDKKILFRKTIIWPWLTLRSKYHEGHYDMRHPHTWMILFKKQLVDPEVTGQGPTKVLDTPPYGHAPTYQISLTYLERQKSYGPDKLRWEAEAEDEYQTKTIYISLCSNGRHN